VATRSATYESRSLLCQRETIVLLDISVEEPALHQFFGIALRTEFLTSLPKDNLAWVKVIISPSIARFIRLWLTINLPPPHPRNSCEDAVPITDIWTFVRFPTVLTKHPLKASQFWALACYEQRRRRIVFSVPRVRIRVIAVPRYRHPSGVQRLRI